jgi:general secretion pathway protein C
MKHLFPTVNIVLLTAICFLAVDTAYTIIAAQLNTVDRHPPLVSGSNIDQPEFKIPPFSKYKAIVERDIFHTRASSIAPAEKIIVENIRPTEKNLKLWGTVVANDPARAYAIIEEPGKNSRQRTQTLYKHGDVVQGAEIKKILREKIILSVNGENEILHIAKPQSSRFSRPRSVARRSTNQPIRRRRTLRTSQIQNAISNINTLMSQANIRPHPEGFQISRIRRSSIFRRMGLRNGDIITAADNRPISSVNDALDIVRGLTGGGKTSLKIKRRGRTRIIDYYIR